MDKPKVSRAAARLEHAGLVRKRVDPRDRRLVSLSLTRKGERLFEEIAHLWRCISSATFWRRSMQPNARASWRSYKSCLRTFDVTQVRAQSKFVVNEMNEWHLRFGIADATPSPQGGDRCSFATPGMWQRGISRSRAGILLRRMILGAPIVLLSRRERGAWSHSTIAAAIARRRCRWAVAKAIASAASITAPNSDADGTCVEIPGQTLVAGNGERPTLSHDRPQPLDLDLAGRCGARRCGRHPRRVLARPSRLGDEAGLYALSREPDVDRRQSARFLAPRLLASKRRLGGTEAIAENRPQVRSIENGVEVTRWLIDDVPAPFHEKVGHFSGKVDRWHIYRFLIPRRASHVFGRSGDRDGRARRTYHGCA